MIPSEKNDENNFITSVADPKWKNESIRFANVLSAQQDKIVSMNMAALLGGSSVKFKMEKETFEETANAYEEPIER